jgi:hypothetical protein
MSDLNFDDIKSNASEEVKFNPESIFKKSKIDLNKKYDRPPLAISVGRDDVYYNGNLYPLRFGTYGNISMIKGEEKARKTFLKSLILASIFQGKSSDFTNGLEIMGHDMHDKYVLDIDTEQDEYDSWLNAQRIPKICGYTPENYACFQLREETPNERLQYVEWLLFESQYRGKVGVLSIDGYVDLVTSFNNEEIAINYTQKLMKWSSQSRCHITGVLHLNPGTDKARGHLGTILQQKCETVVQIKDEGEHSLVYCQRGRGKKFKPFYLGVNNLWLPEIINEPDNKVKLNNKNAPFK